jgi:hypothetical protein
LNYANPVLDIYGLLLYTQVNTQVFSAIFCNMGDEQTNGHCPSFDGTITGERLYNLAG